MKPGQALLYVLLCFGAGYAAGETYKEVLQQSDLLAFFFGASAVWLGFCAWWVRRKWRTP